MILTRETFLEHFQPGNTFYWLIGREIKQFKALWKNNNVLHFFNTNSRELYIEDASLANFKYGKLMRPLSMQRISTTKEELYPVLRDEIILMIEAYNSREFAKFPIGLDDGSIPEEDQIKDVITGTRIDYTLLY